MLLILVLLLACAPTWARAAGNVSAAAPANAHPRADAVEGTLLVHADSPIAGARVFVLLPRSYAEEPSRRYPVLYALDAEDLFDGAVAAGGEEWTLDEILMRNRQGVPELLVVALESRAHAVRDLAPPGSMAAARGDTLLELLVGKVKVWADSTYRTQPGRDQTLLLGLGGSALFALYASWQRADVFGAGIALDCPDMDATATTWTRTLPPAVPWIWFEQRAVDEPRPSNTGFVATLRAHGQAQIAVAGASTPRTQRLLAALVAWARR